MNQSTNDVLEVIVGLIMVGGFLWFIVSQIFRPRKVIRGNDSFGEVVGTLLTAFLIFKGLQKGYEFLQNVDWEALAPREQEAIRRLGVDLDRLSTHKARLDRTEKLLAEDDAISTEEAAMLASATLESGLKELQRRNGVVLGEDAEGMVGLAITLRDKGVISNEDSRQIRRFSSSIRNRVMHGDFDGLDREEVSQQLSFVRIFFSENALV